MGQQPIRAERAEGAEGAELRIDVLIEVDIKQGDIGIPSHPIASHLITQGSQPRQTQPLYTAMASSIILQILLTALFRGVLATLLDDAPEPYLAPQPRAVFSVVPPRVTGSISRPEGVISGRANSPLRHANGAIAHRDSDQVPFVFCPEDFNLPPKTCEQCGGDGKVPGQCDELLLSGRQLDSCWTMNEHCQGYYCSCTHGGEDHSPQITSTAVVNGDTATVVFEPKTLTEYTNLRASTTLTVTETTTTSDGDSGLETGTLVVFAGGVAWWAICKPIPFMASVVSRKTVFDY